MTIIAGEYISDTDSTSTDIFSYYGDSSSQNDNDLTLTDIPIYVGDTDSTSKQNSACSVNDFEPFYKNEGFTSSLYSP